MATDPISNPSKNPQPSTGEPFDIEVALQRIATAITPYPQAGLFTLQGEGFDSTFEILVACILSIRTLDEVMLRIARQLFATARTPLAIASLPLEHLEEQISGVAFAKGKAEQIRRISQRLVAEHDGLLPCDRDLMLTFPGVGPKCANLTAAVACGTPYIGVDIHVHRVTNRWGYVHTSTAEATLLALEAKLPKEHWIAINRLVMPFGKFICKGQRPSCMTCPLLPMCPQIGVSNQSKESDA